MERMFTFSPFTTSICVCVCVFFFYYQQQQQKPTTTTTTTETNRQNLKNLPRLCFFPLCCQQTVLALVCAQKTTIVRLNRAAIRLSVVCLFVFFFFFFSKTLFFSFSYFQPTLKISFRSTQRPCSEHEIINFLYFPQIQPVIIPKDRSFQVTTAFIGDLFFLMKSCFVLFCLFFLSFFFFFLPFCSTVDPNHPSLHQNLPPGWEARFDQQTQRFYFYNTFTKVRKKEKRKKREREKERAKRKTLLFCSLFCCVLFSVSVSVLCSLFSVLSPVFLSGRSVDASCGSGSSCGAAASRMGGEN